MADLLPGQGYVGATAPGVVNLEDANPLTTGSKPPESISYSSEDPAVATVAQDAADPLKLTVTLVGPGTTRVLCHVDPGKGNLFDCATTVEALVPEAGEAVSGTFVLGPFELVPA